MRGLFDESDNNDKFSFCERFYHLKRYLQIKRYVNANIELS